MWPYLFHQCAFWPVRAVERYQGPFNKTLANKILVASNTVRASCDLELRGLTGWHVVQYDPATPLASAEEVVRQLGDDAVLVRQNGFGVRLSFPRLSVDLRTHYAESVTAHHHR